MKRWLIALAALLLPNALLAADNAVIVTPGVGVTMRSKDIGSGVQSMVQIPGDTSGNPTWGTAGTANANILTVQGIASMTALAVSQATAANLNATVVGTGTFAVQAAQSGTWNITNVSGTVSLPTGASTAAKQPALGTAGSASTDVISVQGIASMTPLGVTVASGGIASGGIASGAVASGAFASGAFAAGSFLNATAGDPCMFQAKTNVPISTASGTTALVTGVASKKVYVCSLFLLAPSAVSVSLSEGSSATCGTSNQAAVIGVATNGTAANGAAFAANGGLTLGNGGGTIAATATAANYLCLFQSGTAQIAGNLTYVQQ